MMSIFSKYDETIDTIDYHLPMAERVVGGTPCLLCSLGVREVICAPAGAIVRRVFIQPANWYGFLS